jgi:hypothetical protein
MSEQTDPEDWGRARNADYQTYWLVEHYYYSQPDGHRWLRIWINGSVNGIPKAELTWTNEAQLALRFSRKQDAEHFALLHRDWCVLATVTEHGDMATPSRP